MISPAVPLRPSHIPDLRLAMSGWSIGPRLHIVILLFALIAISLPAHAHDVGVLVRFAALRGRSAPPFIQPLSAPQIANQNRGLDATPLAVRLSVKLLGLPNAPSFSAVRSEQ